MKDNIVTVFLYGKEICRLNWVGGYRAGFGKVGALVSFNPEYANAGFDVDPLGPFSRGSYLVRRGLSDICRQGESEGLPRFLSGSLPDDWGNQVFSAWIESCGLKSHDVTPVDKLAFIGTRGMGGFEFMPEMYEPSADEAIALDKLYRLAKDMLEERSEVSVNLDDNPGINELMSVGMSAGGKHPKAIIAINWKTGEIRSGQILLPEDFTQCILKFRDSESWPTAEVEYIYYQMAVECGITMEKSHLLSAGGVNHFLTERFDRKLGKKRHTATLHSLCGELSSYDEMFRKCRALRLKSSDSEQLFRRAAFNYLSGVTDDHDRNFSFMMDEHGKWELAPAYDLTSTVNYKNRFIGDRHAMSIGDCDRKVSRAQLLELAYRNDIRRAEEIIDEISSVLATFESKARNHVPAEYERLISEFINSRLEKL